ncbi:Ubiquitin carboxyl-terminal hydrolase 48 [Homalodisca vitripennis]|nr:Ubiquitin carboxyl-terminal hydrolase 48 [Homalodisca vitripennis]
MPLVKTSKWFEALTSLGLKSQIHPISRYVISVDLSTLFVAAYIKDGSTGVWNTFNDESVEKLEGKKLKLDEEDPENPKKPKTQRLPKGCQSSTDAYMLVYTSEKHNPSPMEVKLPHKLQEYVDSQNKIFDEFCEEIASSKKRGQERQEQQWQLYNSLSVDGSDDLSEVEAVSTDWLVSWLDSRTDVLRQIDNTRLVCPHDRLDPCVVTGAKYVSSLAVASHNTRDTGAGCPVERRGIAAGYVAVAKHIGQVASRNTRVTGVGCLVERRAIAAEYVAVAKHIGQVASCNTRVTGVGCLVERRAIAAGYVAVAKHIGQVASRNTRVTGVGCLVERRGIAAGYVAVAKHIGQVASRNTRVTGVGCLNRAP